MKIVILKKILLIINDKLTDSLKQMNLPDYQLYGYNNFDPERPNLKDELQRHYIKSNSISSLNEHFPRLKFNGKKLRDLVNDKTKPSEFINLNPAYVSIYLCYLGFDTSSAKESIELFTQSIFDEQLITIQECNLQLEENKAHLSEGNKTIQILVQFYDPSYDYVRTISFFLDNTDNVFAKEGEGDSEWKGSRSHSSEIQYLSVKHERNLEDLLVALPYADKFDDYEEIAFGVIQHRSKNGITYGLAIIWLEEQPGPDTLSMELLKENTNRLNKPNFSKKNDFYNYLEQRFSSYLLKREIIENIMGEYWSLSMSKSKGNRLRIALLRITPIGIVELRRNNYEHFIGDFSILTNNVIEIHLREKNNIAKFSIIVKNAFEENPKYLKGIFSGVTTEINLISGKTLLIKLKGCFLDTPQYVHCNSEEYRKMCNQHPIIEKYFFDTDEAVVN